MKKTLTAAAIIAAGLSLSTAQAATAKPNGYWAHGRLYNCFVLQQAVDFARAGVTYPLFQVREYMAGYLLHFHPRIGVHPRIGGAIMHRVETVCMGLPQELAMQTTLNSLLDAGVDIVEAKKGQ